MNVHRWWFLGLVVSVGASVSCKDCDDKGSGVTADATAASTASASASAAASSSAPSPDPSGNPGRLGHRGMRGGAIPMLFSAAKDLEGLKDDQKTKIDELEKKLQTDDPTARDAMKQLHADLVAGVKAGKLDKAKMDAQEAAIEKAAKARHDKEVEALGGLHGVLDAAQHKAAAAKVRESMAARDRGGRKREGRPEGSARPDAGKPSFAARRFARMTKDLDLDAEQQKKVDAIAPKDDTSRVDMREETKKRTEATLAAFEADTFDPKKIEAPDTKRLRGPMDRETAFLTQLLPILKPEQREKLAARLEKGRGRSHGGPGGWDQRRSFIEEEDDD